VSVSGSAFGRPLPGMQLDNLGHRAPNMGGVRAGSVSDALEDNVNVGAEFKKRSAASHPAAAHTFRCDRDLDGSVHAVNSNRLDVLLRHTVLSPAPGCSTLALSGSERSKREPVIVRSNNTYVNVSNVLNGIWCGNPKACDARSRAAA
jgi:hypothetical protein